MRSSITALVSPLILATGPLWAAGVPGGETIVLQEVLVDQVGDETWLRFRFLAPLIGEGGLDYETRARQMTQLCDTLAIPYTAEYGLKGDVIVISFADRPTEFGVADPDAIQFFEAYRPVDNACIWEDF